MNQTEKLPYTLRTLVVRLLWMLFIPLLVILCACITLRRPPLSFHIWDVAQEKQAAEGEVSKG